MKETILLFFLAWNTLLDIRRKEISLFSTVAVSLCGLLLAFVNHTGIWDFLLPTGGGCIFLILSVLTEGKIGMGDAWILIAMGTMLDLQTYVISLLSALLLASVWSVYLMTVKKKNRTAEIPFLPFLLIGYLGGLCI